MSLTTHNQISVPSFMYGTAWKKEDTARLVQLAVESGFNAIDTANQLIHYREVGVGDALQALQKSGIKREQLFLQTKFTPLDGQGGQPPYDPTADLTSQVKQSIESSLEHLHTDYLDSYVLHGPYSRRGLGSEDWQVWTAIEEHFKSGTTRMIGISNVSAEQLVELCARATVKPMFVQNRCYAITGWDHEVRQICNTHGIIYQGFSLLTANGQVSSNALVREIARRLEIGVAQVIFRFAMDVGMLPLTGTTNPLHMKEDLQVDNVKLSEDDVRKIESIALIPR